MCSLTASGNCVWETTCSAQHTASACAGLVGRQPACCKVTEVHAGAWQCSSTTNNPLPGLMGGPTSYRVPCALQRPSSFLPSFLTMTPSPSSGDAARVCTSALQISSTMGCYLVPEPPTPPGARYFCGALHSVSLPE